MRGRIAVASSFAAALFAAPAHAQGVLPDVIAATIANSHQYRGPSTACLTGAPPSERRVAQARTAAQATMRTYLARAGSSEAADVTEAYARAEGKRDWLSGGTLSPVNAVNDPLARAFTAGTGQAGEPTAFVQAGDRQSAQGVWLLTSADGATRLGHYRVDFRRESRNYRIARLELVEGSADPAPIRQYCENPGDVEEYLALRDMPPPDPSATPKVPEAAPAGATADGQAGTPE